MELPGLTPSSLAIEVMLCSGWEQPPGGQRLLFSATLDRAVDDLVRRFLTDPAVHEPDSPRSPVPPMDHPPAPREP